MKKERKMKMEQKDSLIDLRDSRLVPAVLEATPPPVKSKGKIKDYLTVI